MDLMGAVKQAFGWRIDLLDADLLPDARTFFVSGCSSVSGELTADFRLHPDAIDEAKAISQCLYLGRLLIPLSSSLAESVCFLLGPVCFGSLF